MGRIDLNKQCELCSSCNRNLLGTMCSIPHGDSTEYTELKQTKEVYNKDGTCDLYEFKTAKMKISDWFSMKWYGIKTRYWIVRSFFRNNLYGRIKYGFNIEDTWSLDISVAKYLAPRVRYLANNSHGYPGSLTDELIKTDKLTPYVGKDEPETWHNILMFIADGFDVIADDSFEADDEKIKEAENIKKETLRLFNLFYFNLWD